MGNQLTRYIPFMSYAPFTKKGWRSYQTYALDKSKFPAGAEISVQTQFTNGLAW